jgi:hypothetical protein
MQNLQVHELNPYWLECWQERAAIMQFDGRLPRAAAEQAALADVNKAMVRSGPTARQLLRLVVHGGRQAVECRQWSRRYAGQVIGRLDSRRPALLFGVY